LSQKNFKVKNGLSVNDTEVIDSNAQVDWARLKNKPAATISVAGIMSASDKTKLDGVENEATADQTAAEIRTLVASATDSNVFTDAHQTKLGGIATGADVTPIKDEDNMVSNSATHVPSQQSTKAYVDTSISNLVAAAPVALDTLNELAAALGDDANFATTVNSNIATKLPLAGGTMTGNIVMSGAQTVDGRDLSADGSKLDGIEDAADVTDATNVYTSLGVTAGTATASKALVVDANKDITLGTGDFTCTNCTVTGTLTETSAAVYKENINPLSSQLENIMKLRPVEYDKKATGEHEIGLIADEVEKVLPDFVTQKDGIADSLNYSRMVSVLVKAVQELTEKVEKLSK